jgi:hypothetical protein
MKVKEEKGKNKKKKIISDNKRKIK